MIDKELWKERLHIFFRHHLRDIVYWCLIIGFLVYLANSYNRTNSVAFRDGYHSGYDEGYSAGYQDGESLGYSEGFEEGCGKGYSQGYDAGESESRYLIDMAYGDGYLTQNAYEYLLDQFT